MTIIYIHIHIYVYINIYIYINIHRFRTCRVLESVFAYSCVGQVVVEPGELLDLNRINIKIVSKNKNKNRGLGIGIRIRIRILSK
jgi:hypothetical protein